MGSGGYGIGSRGFGSGGQALVPICVIVVDNCAEVTTGERFPSWDHDVEVVRHARTGA